MEKVRVGELLLRKKMIEDTINDLERMINAMFNNEGAFVQIFENSQIENVSSFDMNGAANHLRDYLKLIENAINTAEADWPLK